MVRKIGILFNMLLNRERSLLPKKDNEIEDFDLEMAIEDIEEDPPLLHIAEGEE